MRSVPQELLRGTRLAGGNALCTLHSAVAVLDAVTRQVISFCNNNLRTSPRYSTVNAPLLEDMASPSQSLRQVRRHPTYQVLALQGLCLAHLTQVSAFSAKLNAPWSPPNDPPSFRESILSKYQRRNHRSRSRRQGRASDSDSDVALEDEEVLEEEALALVDLDHDHDFPNEASTLLAAQQLSKCAPAVPRDVSLAGSRSSGVLAQGPSVSSVSKARGAAIQSSWKPLLQMMRIGNFPGVFLFHVSMTHDGPLLCLTIESHEGVCFLSFSSGYCSSWESIEHYPLLANQPPCPTPSHSFGNPPCSAPFSPYS